MHFATNKNFSGATTPPMIGGDVGYPGLAGYSISNATPNKVYYVRMRAWSSKGYGAWSAVKTVVPSGKKRFFIPEGAE